MSELKECFGRCAHMSIRRRETTSQRYLYLDAEKLKECDECPLFVKCSFLRHNGILKEIIRLLDEVHPEHLQRI